MRSGARGLATALLTTAALALVPTSMAAQAPPVRDVRLSRDSIEIGDRFDLRFTVALPDGAVALFPDSLTGRAFEPYGPVEWEVVASSPEGVDLAVSYPLMAFGTGSVAIPDFDVVLAAVDETEAAGISLAGDRVGSWDAFRESPASLPSAQLVAVPEQRVYVATVLALDDITTQIAPRPAADVSGDDRHWPSTLMVTVFALLLAGVVGVSARDWAATLAAESRPPPPSERDRALRALDELLAASLHRHGRTRDFYAGWSEVVRRYVEGFDEVWGPSWTSTELMRDLGGPRRSTAIERSLVAEAIVTEMRLAEEVKFGGRRPDPDAAETHWRTVRDWVAGGDA